MGPADIHAPGNEHRLRAAFRRMDKTGASLFEHKIIRKDGTILDVEASGTRIPFGNTHIFLGNFREIFERKRIEQELGQYRDS